MKNVISLLLLCMIALCAAAQEPVKPGNDPGGNGGGGGSEPTAVTTDPIGNEPPAAQQIVEPVANEPQNITIVEPPMQPGQTAKPDTKAKPDSKAKPDRRDRAKQKAEQKKKEKENQDKPKDKDKPTGKDKPKADTKPTGDSKEKNAEAKPDEKADPKAEAKPDSVKAPEPAVIEPPKGNLVYCSYSIDRPAGGGYSYCDITLDNDTPAVVVNRDRNCRFAQNQVRSFDDFEPEQVEALQQLIIENRYYLLNNYKQIEAIPGAPTYRIHIEFDSGEKITARWCTKKPRPEAQHAFEQIQSFFAPWLEQVPQINN